MNKLIKIIAFVAVFLAVKQGIATYQENAAVKSAYAEIDAIRADVRKNNPGEPEVLAVQEAAVKKIEDNINAKGTQKEKLETAAGSFLGFYLVNSRQRSEYCANLGVNITPFTSAFKDLHNSEYAIAVKAVAAVPADIDKLYNMLKPQFVTVIEQDMAFIASENDLSLTEACQLISDQAQSLVLNMHISNVQPAVYKILMASE